MVGRPFWWVFWGLFCWVGGLGKSLECGSGRVVMKRVGLLVLVVDGMSWDGLGDGNVKETSGVGALARKCCEMRIGESSARYESTV